MTDNRPPAHIEGYVEVLGPDGAVEVLLEFGGATLYLPTEHTKGDAMLSRLVGQDQALALGKRFGGGHIKVPVAKRWIARHLRSAHGMTISDICRKLHVTEPTVRGYCKGVVADRDQLDLFFKT